VEEQRLSLQYLSFLVKGNRIGHGCDAIRGNHRVSLPGSHQTNAGAKAFDCGVHYIHAYKVLGTLQNIF
jgi:hypothetical protein